MFFNNLSDLCLDGVENIYDQVTIFIGSEQKQCQQNIKVYRILFKNEFLLK